MKKNFLTLLMGFMSLFAIAQEQAIYSHYTVFPILINPGSTGFEDKHQFLLNARRNWTGFPGSPNSYTLMYNGPISDKLSLGSGLFSEKIGKQNMMRLQLNYSFKFRIKATQIGLGLSTEFINKTLSPDLLQNPIIDTNDGALEDAANGQKLFDASVGGFALYDNRMFVGFSMPNTIRARLDDVPVEQTSSGSTLFQHYIFQMGYIFDMPSQSFKIIPSMSLRNVRNVPYQVDFSVQGRFMEDKLIAGLTMRPSTGGAASFLIGTRYQAVQIYYSYDVAFTRFQNYNTGSHELSLAFELKRKVKKIQHADQM